MVGGRRPVLEALSGGWPILRVYIRGRSGPKEIVKSAQARGTEIVSMDEKAFDRKFSGIVQGVCAAVKDVEFTDIDDVLRAVSNEEPPLFVALDGLEDPHNMGAIIRTSLAMGVHALVVPRRRSASLGEGAAKSSAGALFRQTICQVPNISWFIEWAQKNGMWVYGLDMSGQTSVWDTDLSGGIALVVGGEGKGLSRLVRERCDALVKIPMVGEIGSLNASVATGMALSEIRRQRQIKVSG